MNKKTLDKELKPVFPIWVRIVLILLAYTIVASLFQGIGMYITGVQIDDLEALENLTMNQLLVTQVLSAIATVLVVYLFRRYMDKKSMHSLGFSLAHRGADIFWAMVLAFVMITGATLVLYLLLGYIELVVNDFSIITLGMSLLLFVSVSLSEEVLIRGYILNNLMISMPKYLALVMSATIFTLFHLFNPHLSVLSVLNLFIAGILLGTAYSYTKNLWFSISLHTFWNFFQGAIGYPVSGQKIDSILQLKYIGNNTMITGGDFGFEGSILSTIVTLGLTFSIIWFYKKKIA